MVLAHFNNYSVAKDTSVSFLLHRVRNFCAGTLSQLRDYDNPYNNSLLLQLGGVKQLRIKHLAQERNTAALAGLEPTTL